MFKQALTLVATVIVAWLMLVVIGTIVNLARLLVAHAILKFAERRNNF